MRINVSPFRFVLSALVALSLWSAPAFSQRVERGVEAETSPSNTTESNAAEHSNVKAHHESAVQDWTHDHMLYPRIGPMNRLIALQKDPRAIQHWQESYRKDYVRWRSREEHRHSHRNRSYMHADWNISLGAGGFVGGPVAGVVNISVYPAKWTFDINETVTGPSDTASCLNDFLVAPINATNPNPGAPIFSLPPGPAQPNIIGLNNLYSGNVGAGGTGVCNRTPSGVDDGLSATQYFSYTVIGDDGVVTTSPVTSIDGTLIAFVEGSTTAAHFHVLAWKAHDGNDDGVSRQDALSNAIQIPSGVAFVAAAPAAGSGTATDLTLGTATDSLSSPYVEYSDDVAYIGNDAGQIFRIKNVFCPSWAPCGGAAPSLDGTWGSGGILTIGGTCTGMVSGITVDGASGNIFAGCADGNLYAFTPAGSAVTGSPLLLGDGSGIGGIVDAPTLDVVNGWVYVETGSCVSTVAGCVTGGVGAGSPVLAQASMSDLSTSSVATLGPGGTFFNIHAPAFNDAYFTSTTSTDWLLYDYSSDNAGPTPPGGGATPEIVLYGITFGAGHAMVAGNPVNSIGFTNPGAVEVSPVTEFLTTGGEDRLFASAELPSSGNVVSLQINNPPTVSVFPTGLENFSPVQYGTGASGIVADNTASTVGQANSIYFGAFGTTGTDANASTVVKLTQVDLN